MIGERSTATRRTFLYSTGAAGLALPGCLQSPTADGGAGEPTGWAAFFALMDWANVVVGDAIAFETPVEVGRAGHGWDPPADLLPEVTAGEVFVYLGSPDFQWAVDLADTIEDERHEVELIDALAAIPRETMLSFDADEHGSEGDHGHGFFDPHVWLDPHRAERIVDHLAERLGDIVPDASDEFRERADQYIDDIEGVHADYLVLSENAELDVAVGVTHDSFRYLAARYGFELRTPVGVAPDAAASMEDIAGLAQAIEDYDIDTIVYDPFEAPEFGELPQAARLLLDETDAETAEPVTSIEGLTPAWRDAGYGWVEQMREVNLPAFQAALRAES